MSNRRVLVLAVLALLTSACRTTNLDLVADDRVDIVRPDDADHVQNPVVVEWTARDLTVADPGSGQPGVYFALFDNRAALAPGESLISLADEQCRRTPGCATREYFAERSVHLTSSLSYTFERLDEGERHEIAIVLIDAETDTRRGEGSFHVEFFVDEPRVARELTPEDFGG